MRAGGSDFQPVLRSQFRQLSAKIDDLLPGITCVGANLRSKFDDRLVQLRSDPLLQNHLAVSENLLDVRTELARLGIDDLKFFLDAESEDVFSCAHHPS